MTFPDRARVSLLTALLITTPLLAQDPAADPADPPASPRQSTPIATPSTTPPPTPAQASSEEEGFRIDLTPRGDYVLQSDLKESAASVSRGSAGIGVELSGPVGERARWNVALAFDGFWYSFKDASTLLPSGRDPISDAYEFALTPGLTYEINEHWSVLGGAIIDFSAAPGADLGDSATYGGYGGVRYAVSPKLAFTLGAIVRTRLENSTSFFPLIGLEWQVNDRVSVSASPRNGVPAASVDVKLDHNLDVAIFGTYDDRAFRLDSGDAIDQGIVRDERIQIGVALGWNPTPHFALKLAGGVQAYEDLIFDDQNGNRVTEKKVDPTPFVGISGNISF